MENSYKITEKDCKEILQKHLGTSEFTLIEFYEVATKVIGIMGGHFKLQTKVKIGENVIANSFFVKRMTCNTYEIQTQMIKEQGAYEKENFAYEVLTKLYEEGNNYKCDFMPKCYFKVKDELFVFEDVIESGCKLLNDYLELFDLEHLEAALKMIAKFHAGSIIYESKQSEILGKPFKMSDLYQDYFIDSMYRKNEPNYLGTKFISTSVNSVLALIDVVPFLKQKRNEIKFKFLSAVDQTYELAQPSKKYCNVVCHGDLWNSNILFKYDNDNKPIQGILLDYQAIRYTVPAHDFLYFIKYNCPGQDQDHYKKLASYYHEQLTNILKENNIDVNNHITLEEFLETLDYIEPLVIVQNICFATLCLVRMYDFVREDQNEVKKFFYEDRSELCVKAYEENELFRNVVKLPLQDLNKLL